MNQENVDEAILKFNDTFLSIVNKHAPVKRFTVKNKETPWLDKDLKQLIKQREQAKEIASFSGKAEDWILYRKLRNQTTKLNRNKRKLYYGIKIDNIKNDNKKLWKIINDLTGRKKRRAISFIEVDGNFLTQPSKIANYFNDYFTTKVESLRMTTSNNNNTRISNELIKNVIMEHKHCKFNFMKIETCKIENALKNLKNKPPGMDEMC